jgi:methyltransferase
MSVEGGEVEFIRRMIDESQLYKTRIRVYTTMLGKKSSVAPLQEHLNEMGIENSFVWTIGQGKTSRWFLAWSYDPVVKFKVCF